MAENPAAQGRDPNRERGTIQKVVTKAQKLFTSVMGFVGAKLGALARLAPPPILIAWAILLFSIFGSWRNRAAGPAAESARPVEVGYSTFLNSVKRGQVAEATLGVSSVTFQLNDGSMQLARIPRAPPDVVNLLDKNKIPFSQMRPGAGQLLLPYLGLIIYLGVVGYFGWQMLGRGSAGKVGRRAQPTALDRSLTFDDIKGIDQAKAQVMQVVDIMKNPYKYTRLGARQPRGILLVGPPGTGKTLLARVVASRLGMPFFFASGSDFVEMFVGRGASRVRELFNRAAKEAPCVIFIDELDALGKSRGSGVQIVRNDEGEQTLNQLLACMDGLDTKGNGIVVIAATNRYDVLDDALVRPGRFDRVVRVPMPDKVGREAVLKVHAKTTVLDRGVNFSKIADITEGFSPAELASIVNEAIIRAATAGNEKVTQEDLEVVLTNFKLSRGKGTLFGKIIN